ncbi:flagellar hook-basal body complex protein [Nitrobacter sp. NHB1]|uniref:flagellar hook-basal body complex protein n=1 Tax=Nitrobacter sp. NHB1 TaxID=3119830 RepID=UPI002FFF47D7
MGIFDALNTSVGGLQAQSFALQNISGNIANAQTTGYKGITTAFSDLIPDSTSPNRQVAGGVTAYATATISSQGTVSASTVGTYMAITGDGFFNVQAPTGKVDNQPQFSGVTYYTRRGDFQVDANGNLVNSAGYYLMGVAVDPKTGNPLGNVPKVLQFQNNFVPAQATTTLQYAANLPAVPTTLSSPTATAGTITAAGGLNPSDFTTNFNPLVVGTPAPPHTDNSTSGSPAMNQLTPPLAITSATKLSGTAPSDSLPGGFAVNDTIVVDSQTITFTAAGVGLQDATHVRIDDTVGDLLGKIGAITGQAPTIDASTGAITLHTGTAQDLSVTSASAGWTSMGFGATTNIARGGGGTPGAGVVIANDQTIFQQESISGGAVTVYDSTGTAVNLQLRWAKTDSASLGAGHADTWNMFYQANPNATGTQPAWINVGTNFTFGTNGQLSSPVGSSITIPSVSVGTQSLGNLTLNLGTGGLTQYASSGGNATINAINQNGYAAGQLQSVAVNNDGIVVGTFSNGQNLSLAQVSLSHFNGTNYLKALDGGAYAVTDESGPAIAGAAGHINGSSLEGSNTDIADEFTKLIVTQQAYSANTKVITTANSMVQDLLNVLR